MFDLWRLKRSRRKVARAFEHHRQKLKKSKKATPHDLEELSHEEWTALQPENDRINAFLSDQLWEEAREYDIQIPRGDEMWEDSYYGDRKYLSMVTRSNLRRLIDEEKARRFEVKTLWLMKFWLPLLASLVGIIGALTGLVAVMGRHHPEPERKPPAFERLVNR